jgi:hypothetical protein
MNHEQLGDILFDQAMWQEYREERIQKIEEREIIYSYFVMDARVLAGACP